MRYPPGHKAEVRRKIVKDAAQRLRSEGIGGAAVAAVMRDNGLTHGGFYKHFASKDELLLESLHEAFEEIGGILAAAVRQHKHEAPWKAIVRTYLSPEYCAHPERGCPLPALGPELARVRGAEKSKVVAELANYKNRMVPFMPGRRQEDKERAFFAIFSTMAGAIQIARILPEGPAREKVLASARDFLLRSF
jgi:TetR/AcrR family transcriptional regulator, transcriptional repressor for nem operon